MHIRPFHMWVVDVEQEAKVALARPLSPEWRKRLQLWQDSGESVSGAAYMLRTMEENRRREAASWEADMRRACRAGTESALRGLWRTARVRGQ